MPFLSQFRRRYAFAFVCVCVAAFGVAGGAFTSRLVQSSQEGRIRSVVKKFTAPNDPLAITVEWNHRPMNFGDKIDGDDDWLRTISLKFKNVSAKPIVFATIDFDFPETTSSGPIMSYQIHLGQRPGFPSAGGDPLYLRPNETYELQLSTQYDFVERFVKHRHQMSDIHRATIGTRLVIYEDMTGWSLGDAIRVDPANPKRYIPL